MALAPNFLLVLLLAQGAGPKPAEALLRRGLIDLQQGRLPDARKSLEAASRLEARNPVIWSALAQTCWKLKDQACALRSAQSAEEFGAGNSVVAHALAIFYGETGDLRRAAYFERAHARAPDAGPGAIAGAASLSLDAGEPAEALPFAQQALEKDPSPANRNLLGRVQIAAGNIAAGLSDLSEAWKAEPKNEQFCFHYAQALLNRGDFPGAAAPLEQGVVTHPKSAQLRLALGVARYGQRRFEDAADSFLKTISIDPSVEQPYLFLGRMLTQAGPRLAEITTRYRVWNTREPGNYRAPLLLAKAISAGGGEAAEIEPLLRRSIRLNPEFWEAHFELGLVLLKQTKFQEAAAELARSAALNPKEPLPHYHLARVYDRLGESDKAAAERKLHAELTGAQ
jgi:tetratricopeptide (TPR) repeat protein